MELSFGEARRGIGGGICQLSNLIHWMAIHSPLVVVERSNHSFDPFPDEGRVLPFSSGAAIFYNYVDLVLHNPTDRSFSVEVECGGHAAGGRVVVRSGAGVSVSRVSGRASVCAGGERVYRENEIWREVREKGAGGGVGGAGEVVSESGGG
jgi:vancomycin resistance protein VanW